MTEGELITKIQAAGWKFQLIAEVPLAGSTKTGWRVSVSQRRSDDYLVHEWAEHESLVTALRSILFNTEQDRNRPGTKTWVDLRGPVAWKSPTVNINELVSNYIMMRKKRGDVGFEKF